MESPFPWPGGKRALRNTLLELIPQHSLYVEVFAGSAKLLFAKPPSRMEIINDLNGEVINFFRVAKHRPAELAERLELECVHSERFLELRRKDVNDTFTCEVERALRFAYLVWYSFGAKGAHFARPSAKSTKVKRPLSRVRDLLQATAFRLWKVSLEQRDFADVLARYDSPETFFYLDPPYVSFQPNARYTPLSAERRVALFDTLAKIKGRFLMSFDNHAEVRALSQRHGFQTKRVGVVYTLAGNRPRRESPELLIANYPLHRLA